MSASAGPVVLLRAVYEFAHLYDLSLDVICIIHIFQTS